MAADKIINLRIDVAKLNKEWFFKGQKGTYADLTFFYNEEKDQYESNGMVVQSVPKAVREADSSIKGPILGNGFEFVRGGGVSDEMRPESNQKNSSSQNSTIESSSSDENEDDLPF